MGYRRFIDRDGRQWEVRDVSSAEWVLQPVGDNVRAPQRVRAPGYESDPFELSAEELQGLLDDRGGAGGRSGARRSPFKD